MEDGEINAIAKINAALTAVEDPEARKRVLRWANEKFGFSVSTAAALPLASPIVGSQQIPLQSGGNEIPGVALLAESGDVRFTIRDPKARSARDATTRLTYAAIHAAQLLTGKKTISRQGVVVPLLKHWRVYDGNARSFLSRDKGILKNGDELALDGHAQKDAERYLQEIQNQELAGSWKPGSSQRKRESPKISSD